MRSRSRCWRRRSPGSRIHADAYRIERGAGVVCGVSQVDLLGLIDDVDCQDVITLLFGTVSDITVLAGLVGKTKP